MMKTSLFVNKNISIQIIKEETITNLTYISPSFIVSNLKASIAFYIDKLGFEVRFIGPDDDPTNKKII